MTRVREEERKRDRQILQEEERLRKAIKDVRFERNKENEKMEIQIRPELKRMREVETQQKRAGKKQIWVEGAFERERESNGSF